MTDEVQAAASAPAVAPATSSSSESVNTNSGGDIMVPQSHVSKMLGTARTEAREKGRQEALRELQSQNASQTANASVAPQSSASMGGMPQVSEEQFKEMFKKLAPEIVPNVLKQEAQNLHYQRIADSFLKNLQKGPTKYADFEKVVAPLDMEKIAEIIPMVEGTGMTEDIMYELGKHPAKAITLLNAVRNGVPHLAELEMRNLTESIKQNETALKQKTANEPLGQIKPSIAGTDNGKSTVSDLRKQDWMRA